MKLRFQTRGFSWLPWCSKYTEQFAFTNSENVLVDLFFGWLWFQFWITYVEKSR